jgi:hypothetical protein
MDEGTDIINAIVESYFKELVSLASRLNMSVTAATLELDTRKRQRKTNNEIRRIKNEIDYLLNEFNDIHMAHILELWEISYILLTDENDGREKIVDIKLKDAFKEFQILSNRAMFRLKNRSMEFLEDFKVFEMSHREKELTNLNQITTDIIYDSWMNRVNPVNGEKV